MNDNSDSQLVLINFNLLFFQTSSRLLSLVNDPSSKNANPAGDGSDKVDKDSSFVALESELVSLYQGKTLHWRHEQMCLASLLMLIVPG